MRLVSIEASRGLHQNMDAAGISVAAFGIADHPTNGVACRDRARSRELFAFLERDIRDLSRRGINLVQRTRTVGG